MKRSLIYFLLVLCVIGFAYAECNDGLDNDGDGLVDYSGTNSKGPDMGCFGPDDTSERALSPEQEQGWYTFNKHSETNIVYVSDSQGSDSNNGTIGYPVKTLDKGVSLIRAGNLIGFYLKLVILGIDSLWLPNSWGSSREIIHKLLVYMALVRDHVLSQKSLITV